MGGFYVHRSNVMIGLVAALRSALRQSPGDPWRPETIVVQGRGMERWLAMRLAEDFGGWCNARYPFPRAFIEEIIDTTVGPLDPDPYRRMSSTLTIAELLPSLRSAEVERYLGGDARRRYALSVRLADLFDRYLVYRPEWALEGFPDVDHWQARLWARLVERLGSEHFASRAARARRALRRGVIDELSPRVSIFGVTTLPPAYLQLLAAYSAHAEVHLFVQTPSREYWGDGQRQLSILDRERDPALLEVLGKHAQQFQRLLEDLGYEPGVEAYREPGTRTLLSTLQSDMLHYRCRSAHGAHPPIELRDDDASVRVHVCHSAMREAEVVHDVLRDAFERHADLQPHDVAVLVPRIDDYAPFIDAVFAPREAIPYRISDRSHGASDPEQLALEAWLTAAAGRISSAELLDLLEHAPIRRAFDIAEEQIEELRRWVVEAGIRWGADREHRVAEGHPPDDTGTWRFGFDRLWMGFAVDDARHSLVGDVAPASLVRGSRAALLGVFELLVDAVAETGRLLREEHTVSEWAEILEGVADRLTEPTSRLRAELRAHTAELTRLGGDEALAFDAVETLVLAPLRSGAGSFGFGAGSVTVCEMLPMRAIPFELVVVMGMNDQEFPRPRARDGLDLTLDAPRPGDPDSVSDDRNLFLEAILSARRELVVTHVGRSIKDNEQLPPSGVVAELLSTCAATARLPMGEEEAEDARESEPLLRRLRIEHPLHPFSRRYFNGELYTFEKRYEQAAATRPKGPGAPILTRPGPAAINAHIELETLLRSLHHPPEYFFRQVLGARVPDEASVTPERESLVLDGLTRWGLTKRALEELAGRDDPAAFERELQRRGTLSWGSLGALQARRLLERGRALLDLASAEGARGSPEDAELSVELGPHRLSGRLGGLYGRRRFFLTASKHYEGVDLREWIRHLFGVAAGRIDSSFWIGFEKKPREPETAKIIAFSPLSVEEARGRLAELIEVFELGHRVPLPLFREPSARYARAIAQDGPENAEDARRAAFKKYCELESRRGPWLPAPLFDPAAVVARGEPVCGVEAARFGPLSERVYGPALRGSDA